MSEGSGERAGRGDAKGSPDSVWGLAVRLKAPEPWLHYSPSVLSSLGVRWSDGFFYRSRIRGSWRHVMEMESRSKENGHLWKKFGGSSQV